MKKNTFAITHYWISSGIDLLLVKKKLLDEG